MVAVLLAGMLAACGGGSPKTVDPSSVEQSIRADVTRQGGALKLMNATSRLRDLLVITKLVTVFECFDQEAAALASFAALAPEPAEVAIKG